jgi:phosphomevalonate kinase
LRAVAASAPGKLILIGEYSVLVGHPAVVMAVNRRAHVNLRPAAGASWTAVAPGFEDTVAAFDLDRDHGVRWVEPGSAAAERLVLFERVLGALATAGGVAPDDLVPASIALDTREFFQPTGAGPAKLGLGSSAALTVALVGAIRRWAAGVEASFAVDLGTLLELHRSVQGGRGSGIDLAASRFGGVLEYRLAGDDAEPSATALRLPADLGLVAVWTGRPASTASFLTGLDDGMRDDGGSVAAALHELGAISAAGVGRLRAGDTGGFLDEVVGFGEALDRLGAVAAIPILSDEHLELRRLAHEFGVRYKPSGAGGGDVGLGLTDDPGAAAGFRAKVVEEGFLALDLDVDPVGVEVHHS